VQESLRGLLVDYGGVLTNPLVEARDAWLRADGIDPQRFAEVSRRWLASDAEPNAVHDLETGRITVADFERRLAEELAGPRPAPAGTDSPEPVPDNMTELPPAAGTPATTGMLARMFAGLRPDPGMIDVVLRARQGGVRTGLLSNSWGLDYPREGWDRLFDVVVISGEVGLRKPDPAIYELAAQRLGLPPAQVVFVDDLPSNVQGAVAAGMVGIRHRDLDSTVEELEILLGLSLR
jgi:FMN phosphatase YigB (HAD superfamily)